MGDRTRIPDVTVLRLPYTSGRIAVDVPLVVVEVKSPDDTFDDIMEKCFEYATLGVSYILVFDPDHRRMYHFTNSNLIMTLAVNVVAGPGVIPVVAEELFNMLTYE